MMSMGGMSMGGMSMGGMSMGGRSSTNAINIMTGPVSMLSNKLEDVLESNDSASLDVFIAN